MTSGNVTVTDWVLIHPCLRHGSNQTIDHDCPGRWDLFMNAPLFRHLLTAATPRPPHVLENACLLFTLHQKMDMWHTSF